MRRKKRLIPTILTTLLCWIGLGYLLYKISPRDFLPLGPFSIPSVLLFFLLFSLALIFSFSLIFSNSRRGFLIALGIIIIALLRFFSFFHPLYIVFTLALLITVELYFLKK